MPTWRRTAVGVRGTVRIAEAHDDALNRHVRTATLLPAPAEVPRSLPPLRDVALVHCDGDRWTLTGFEAVTGLHPDTLVHYQQSWLLVPTSEEDERAARVRELSDANEAQQAAFVGPPKPAKYTPRRRWG